MAEKSSRVTPYIEESIKQPCDAEREGYILGRGGKAIGMPERKVVALKPEEFTSGDCGGEY